MGTVNVKGSRMSSKRRGRRILPSHARRAYERTKQHLKEQTEDNGKSLYESADELLGHIRQGVEGEISPLAGTVRSVFSRPKSESADHISNAVNVAGANPRIRRATVSTSSAASETNRAARQAAAKRYAVKNATGKKPKLRQTKDAFRRTTQAVSNTVRSILSAARNLVLSLSAGGLVMVILVVIVCIIGLLVSYPFGVFFSGEDTGTGLTMQDAVRQIDLEYTDRLAQIRASMTYDSLEMSGSRAVWPDVLTVYAVKTTMDPATSMEVASITDEKLQLLKNIFWQMNKISYETQTVTRTEIIESADEDGNIIEEEVAVTKTVLYITVTHKTATEMARELGFSEAQLLQMDELLSEDYRSLWSAVLYGIHSTNEQIVSVALSQLGNLGGEPYWSWYGFDIRVEWCACFVSWCANECGYIDAGVIPKFASCRNGMLWFQSRGQWLPGTAEPTPGMIIFFDWDDENGQDGLPDHVGIVQKVEDGIIHTVEGNSDNACKIRQYPIGYYELLGFGSPVF